MGVKFNARKAFELFRKSGGKTNFPDSLKRVLNNVQDDPNFNDVKEVAWLLATAKVESDYSLTRWEADYLCGKWGNKNYQPPCQSALNYYRSTSGKKNYFDLGVDNKGLPYFGRGLIQLTGKRNYELYSNKTGKNLVADANKALEPDTSYQIASDYFSTKKSGYPYTANQYAMAGNFPMARKIVKGSSSGWEKVKGYYDTWVDILRKSDLGKKRKIKGIPKTKKEKTRTALTWASIALILAGVGVGIYLYKKK
jgi:predicted chitinase